jgi:hypothetical protein
LRFAVHRPGIPEASPRGNGVPRRNILRCVYVGVAGIPAGSAAEARLALARLPVHVPTRRASLACERRRHLLNSSWCLLLQATDEQPPARAIDASVESSLGCYAPSWIVSRSSSRTDHGPNVQILNPDYVESLRDVSGGLLGPVPPAIRLARLQARNRPFYRGAPIRTGVCPSEPPLKAPQPSLLAGPQATYIDHLACRQRRADNNAPVNAYYFAVGRRRHRVRNPGKSDMPALSAVACDPEGLRALRNWTGPAKPNPAHLGNADFTSFASQAANITRLERNDPEPFVPTSFAPRRPAVRSRHEIGHRLSEVSQCLLLHHLGAFAEPRSISARCRELPALFQVAGSACAAGLPPSVLLHCEVPHKAGMRAVAQQYGLLFDRRHESIPTHANIVANKMEGRERRAPGGHPEAPAPLL